MKNKKTFNCKDVKLTQELHIYNSGCLNGEFKYALRRCNTSKKFFEDLDKQLPNQLLYNTEEKEAYFLNSDRQLFKLKFEPIIMKNKKKNQTTEEYLEELGKAYSKVEIQNLAVPWNSFYRPSEWVKYNRYDLCVLTDMFVSLLELVKKKQIKVRCGIGMMHLLTFSPIYYSTESGVNLKIGTCQIDLELDFDLAKYDLMYDDILLVGESVVKNEPKEVKIEEEKHKKKILGIF